MKSRIGVADQTKITESKMISSHETIHSGHFMTSNPHTDQPPDDDDEDVEVDVVEDEEKPDEKRKEFQAAVGFYLNERPVTYYKFGPQKTQSFAIDVSLNKLNRCIRVAYNKMTTPRWKDFKGLRLHWKQRIRLNNVIWRAYYMEFGRKVTGKKKSPYCYFAVPDDDTTHVKIEGTVLEGMYWKRRVEAVCAQYKRWRHFWSKKHDGHKKKKPPSMTMLRGLIGGKVEKDTVLQRSQTPKNTSTEWFDIDDLENEFTDNLFDSLNQPYMFPNPRDLSELCGNPDIVQPGLLSLQPSLEEIMASLIGDEMANEDAMMDPDMPGPSRWEESRWNGLRPSPLAAPLRNIPVGSTTAAASSSSSVSQSPSTSSRLVAPPTLSTPLPAAHLRPSSRPTQQYSQKDYQAANMLLDYSNQPSAAITPAVTPTTLQSVPIQPTRQSSLGSPMMLSQPQYSTATGYGIGVPQLHPLQQVVQPLQQQPDWKALQAQAASNAYLVTGGDVVPNMDYMPQFLSGPSTAYRLSSTVSPLSAGSPMLSGSIPGISSPLGAGCGMSGVQQQQLAAAAAAAATSRWPSWMDSITPGPSSSSVSISSPSPLILPPTPSIMTTSSLSSLPTSSVISPPTPSAIVPPLSRCTVNKANVGAAAVMQRTTTIRAPQSAAAPLPRESLTERLVARSGLGGSPLSATSSTVPQAPPSSASAEAANGNPWDSEDPGPSTLFTRIPMEEAPAVCRVVKEEVGMERIGGGKKATKQVQADSTLNPSERKRILHLHAEQSRRHALKDGFDQLLEIVPEVHSGGIKPTNAVVLARAADYIKELKSRRDEKNDQVDAVKDQIRQLKEKIMTLQSSLPSSRRDESATLDQKTAIEQFYERYTRERTKQDWRYWLMAQMLKPMVSSYANAVHSDPSDRDMVGQTAACWMRDQWRVSNLRPFSSEILVYLATNTSILKDPSSLREHIEEQITK